MKNNIFNKLENELNALTTETSNKRHEIEKQAVEALEKKLKNNKALKAYIVKLENSKDLTWIEHDEYIYSWIRFYASDFIDVKSDLQKQAFSEFLQDCFCVTIDFKNDALMYCLGPCIVINDDGDVYDQDSGKFFVSKKDYTNDDGETDENERNKLIENYMEKTGCFPAVVSADRYNNIFFVNTKEKQ